MPNPVLNTIHPLYPYLLKVWPFKEGSGTPVELISGTPITVDAGSITWTQESSGWGITLDTGDAIGIGADVYPTTPNLTILYRRRKTDSTLRQAGHFGYEGDGTTSRRCSALLPGDAGTILFDFGTPINNQSRLTVSGESWDTTLDTFVIRVTANEIRMWRNGTDIGHTTSGNPIADRVNNGGHGRINSGFNTTGDKQFVDLFALYTGEDLDDAACADLSAFPNDIFVGGMTGAIAVTITAAATLRPGAALTGSTGLDVSVAGNLLPPALAGTTGATMTAVAQLRDNAALFLAMMIASEVQSPLIVQMDILGVDVDLEPALLLMEILESVRDAALLTMNIVPEALVTSEDVQAPVADVALS